MQTALEIQRTAYAVGEEVVVRLDDVEVRSTGDGAIVAASALPPWTIGEVGVAMREDGGERYAIFFLHDDALCACVVTPEAIEGTA